MFRLNKDIYNGYTKATSNTSVICTLKKKNKASYIEDAVNKKPIVSVCGELLVCDGSIFNFPSVIEWNYQSNDNIDTQTDEGEKTNKKRKKNLENLQKISNKYKGKDKKELKNKKVSGVKKPSSKKKGNNSNNLENFMDLVNDVTSKCQHTMFIVPFLTKPSNQNLILSKKTISFVCFLMLKKDSKDKGETVDISENNNEGDECEDSNTVDEDAGTEADNGGD
jgi:hypothetical protein